MVLPCRTPPVPCDCEVTTATTTTEHHLLQRRQWLQRQQQLLHSLCRLAWLPRRPFHRLAEALVIGACFLSIVRLPPLAMSAPASSPSPGPGDPSYKRLFQQRMKWVNPCGLASSEMLDSDIDLVSQASLNDETLLQQIIVQAKNALMHADLFREDYVTTTFKNKYVDHHNSWKSIHYDWLPKYDEIPKSLGEEVPMGYLDKLELNSALRNTYEYLQKFAVGLEQVVFDQIENDCQFADKFRETEFKLRSTLCEIQVAMMERGVTQRKDVTRDLMNSEFRAMNNSSHRNLRDWLIFRDYMNGLEYCIQVFEYFREKIVS